MRHILTQEEIDALHWLNKQSSPVYSFKKNDPTLETIVALIKKRLVKRLKVIKHPTKPFTVSCFQMTLKGKRYQKKLGE